jgi:hypothetical protein
LDWRYHLAIDTNLLREQLGFIEPVARDDALRRTVGWERAHPPGKDEAALFDYAAEDTTLAAIRSPRHGG